MVPVSMDNKSKQLPRELSHGIDPAFHLWQNSFRDADAGMVQPSTFRRKQAYWLCSLLDIFARSTWVRGLVRDAEAAMPPKNCTSVSVVMALGRWLKNPGTPIPHGKTIPAMNFGGCHNQRFWSLSEYPMYYIPQFATHKRSTA